MSVKKLKSFLELTNIADEFDEQKLRLIGDQVKRAYETDLSSMSEWLKDAEKVVKLASLKTTTKNTPFPDAANIKLPLITKSVYEWASRVYPEIIKDSNVVKTRVIGRDPLKEKEKQAQRVADYMNYQILFADSEWEAQIDKLLTLLALIGFICQKTYYDPVRDKIKFEICDFNSLIINSKAKSLREAPQISHKLSISLNDMIEHVRAGVFLEEPVKKLINQHSNDDSRPDFSIIEQHCFIDLDEDDYAEPYIVTILLESGEVLRIAPRFNEDGINTKSKTKSDDEVKYIDAIQLFNDYHFLPNPKGTFQSVGFGILLLHLTETSNTLLNQVVDAGRLANLQGGYIDARAKVVEGGNSLHDPGELRKMKTANGLTVADSVHMFNFKEPSNVLFQTLGLLLETSRDLTSTTDVMTGNSGTDNLKTGAVLALQEEGRKVATAIQKRVYRSLCNHFKQLFDLNKQYLDPNVYIEVLDDDLAISNIDFDKSKIDVIPVADPNLSSETSRMAKAQFLLSTIAMPGVKPEAVTRRVYESTNIENVEELLMSDEEMAEAKQTPNPEVIKIQGDLEYNAQDLNMRGRELDLKEKQFMLDAYRTECELLKMKTESIKNLAQAEAAEAGTQMQDYNLQLSILQEKIKNVMEDKYMSHERGMHEDEMAMRQQEVDNERAAQTVAQPPSDQGVS